jgi:hypothetical protein
VSELIFIPCETCGSMNGFTATKRCQRCYNIETHLWDYISTKNGHDFVVLMLVHKAKKDLEQGGT